MFNPEINRIYSNCIKQNIDTFLFSLHCNYIFTNCQGILFYFVVYLYLFFNNSLSLFPLSPSPQKKLSYRVEYYRVFLACQDNVMFTMLKSHPSQYWFNLFFFLLTMLCHLLMEKTKEQIKIKTSEPVIYSNAFFRQNISEHVRISDIQILIIVK